MFKKIQMKIGARLHRMIDEIIAYNVTTGFIKKNF